MLNTYPDPDPICIQGFDDQNLEENLQLKIFIYFFDKKLQFIYPWASIKDVQATGEAFSPQKRKSSPSKHKIS
jgi:hypothetical protein